VSELVSALNSAGRNGRTRCRAGCDHRDDLHDALDDAGHHRGELVEAAHEPVHLAPWSTGWRSHLRGEGVGAATEDLLLVGAEPAVGVQHPEEADRAPITAQRHAEARRHPELGVGRDGHRADGVRTDVALLPRPALRRDVAQQDRGDPGLVGVVPLGAVREELTVHAVDGEAAAQPDRQRVELLLEPIGHSDKCRRSPPQVRAFRRCGEGRGRPTVLL
jgi:hypothetical protein